ncbi:MAG: hypothetical protein PVI86_05980 [Phycisphaerae bacterium]|jgi:hypothetical protein
MSKGKKRVYLALMGLGGVALLVDRFILPSSGTEPSQALALATDAPNAVDDVDDPPAPPSLSIPELPFPRALEPLDDPAAVRDLFVPPPSALAPNNEDDETDNSGSGPGGPGQDAGLRSVDFITEHRLTGVFIAQGLKIAVVDKEGMQMGDVLDGCELVSIAGNEARFQCPDGDATLKVIEPGASLRD